MRLHYSPDCYLQRFSDKVNQGMFLRFLYFFMSEIKERMALIPRG